MKKVEWCCDRCGKQIDLRNGYFEQDVGFETVIVVDLCCECANELEKMIIEFCSCEKQKECAG